MDISDTSVNCFDTGGIATMVVFKFVYGARYKTKIAHFITIYRISIGKMALLFAFYLNFSTKVSTDI